MANSCLLSDCCFDGDASQYCFMGFNSLRPSDSSILYVFNSYLCHQHMYIISFHCYSNRTQKQSQHKLNRTSPMKDTSLTGTSSHVNKSISIGSDNGLLPGRHQAIIWTNAGKLLIGPFGTNFREILIEIHAFSFKKMPLKMSSGKSAAILSWPQCVKSPLPVPYNSN